MTTPPTVPPTPNPAPPSVDVGVLARHHEATLATLARIPYDLDYVTPEEILVILRLCYEYQVDFTQGLEPAGRRGEAVNDYQIPVITQTGLAFQEKPCRVRREVFLENPAGTWIPDGNTVWAHRILGLLRYRVRLKLEAILERRS